MTLVVHRQRFVLVLCSVDAALTGRTLTLIMSLLQLKQSMGKYLWNKFQCLYSKMKIKQACRRGPREMSALVKITEKEI